MPAPLRHPLLTALSPAFQTYINGVAGNGHGHNEVESMLWVSSPGAECSPHYDMHHNFFLQLAGTKTFIITEPASGLLLYKPHSSLHPHWRQAQHVFSRSFDHDDGGDGDGGRGRGRGVDAIAAAGAAPGIQERLELLFGQDNRDNDGPWEVTLQPGDMLCVLYCYTIVLPFFSCL